MINRAHRIEVERSRQMLIYAEEGGDDAHSKGNTVYGERHGHILWIPPNVFRNSRQGVCGFGKTAVVGEATDTTEGRLKGQNRSSSTAKVNVLVQRVRNGVVHTNDE